MDFKIVSGLFCRHVSRYEMYFQNKTFTEVYLSGYQLRAQFTFEH